MVKRGRLEIMKDILEIISSSRSIRFTPLLRKSNLSTNRFMEYYKELLIKDFIKEKLENDEIRTIFLSEKGIHFLERYNAIKSFIDEFDL